MIELKLCAVPDRRKNPTEDTALVGDAVAPCDIWKFQIASDTGNITQ
jgi:hypothetical protein